MLPAAAVLGSPEWERIVLAIAFSALVASGVLSLWSDRTTRRYVVIAACVPLALLWLEVVYKGRLFNFVSGGMRLGMVSVFAVVLFSRVLAEGPVTRARIKGAVAVYLLLGVIFAEAFRMVAIVDPSALTIQSSNPLSLKYTAELMYFSFSTLTTAGYGDIVPVHPVARSMANAEAIAGQMYVVLLIGRLVSQHWWTRTGRAPRSREALRVDRALIAATFPRLTRASAIAWLVWHKRSSRMGHCGAPLGPHSRDSGGCTRRQRMDTGSLGSAWSSRFFIDGYRPLSRDESSTWLV